MPVPVPHTLAELHAAWLAAALEADISQLECAPMGVDRGFTGLLARIDYPGGSCVAKLASGQDGWRELAFYQRLAERLPIRLPQLLFGAHDAVSDRTILLLEHIHPARPGDNLLGCSPADASALLRTLARLHAAFWEQPLDREEWLLDTRDPSETAERLRTRAAGFLQRWGDRLPAPVRSQSGALASALPRIWQGLSAAPQTLVHDDFHLDNVLFQAGEPVILDWQIPARGAAAIDIARFLVECLTVEQRRALGRSWLDIYTQELSGAGVVYDSEALALDVQRALLRCFAGLLGCTAGQRAPHELSPRLRQMVEESIDRLGWAVAEQVGRPVAAW